MTDLAENMAKEIAERLNGGEFDDDKWYTDGQRAAWINAVKPFADEIEKLQAECWRMKEERDRANSWRDHDYDLVQELKAVLREMLVLYKDEFWSTTVTYNRARSLLERK